MKVVRESMNEMVKAWKELPDVLNEVSPTPKSQFSSNGMPFHPHKPYVSDEKSIYDMCCANEEESIFIH